MNQVAYYSDVSDKKLSKAKIKRTPLMEERIKQLKERDKNG